MKLTPVLHTFLNRVWGKSPDPVVAFQVSHTAPMTWVVADQVLSLTAGASTLTIDLTQYTLSTLTAFVSSQPGYSVTAFNASVGGLGAIVILDGAGDYSSPLQAYTALRWALLDAMAKELHDAEGAAAAAAAQLATTTASGYWLDELGSYLGAIMRNSGEEDPDYAMRIPASVLQSKCNNFAIAAALEKGLGLTNVTVTDVIVYGPTAPLFNGAINFDGSRDYNASPTIEYGMFDISGYGGGEYAGGIQAEVVNFVENLRASGCHVRNVAIQNAISADGGGFMIADQGGVIYTD